MSRLKATEAMQVMRNWSLLNGIGNLYGSLFFLPVVKHSFTMLRAFCVVSLLFKRHAGLTNADTTTCPFNIWRFWLAKLAMSSLNILSGSFSGNTICADQLMLVKQRRLRLYDYQTVKLHVFWNPVMTLRRNNDRRSGSNKWGRRLSVRAMAVRCPHLFLL